jgi:hypothetical protein
MTLQYPGVEMLQATGTSRQGDSFRLAHITLCSCYVVFFCVKYVDRVPPSHVLSCTTQRPILNKLTIDVRFEVFTAVTVKNDVFWDVAPCRSCVNRCFGEMYRLHLQGRKIHERGTSVSRWLKMEAIRSSETSVHTRSTRRHIPEDGIHYEP